ncbi:hypothetical protein SporoP37_00275 [Sporosarcina sp. P37]|nr:hypothetical protein SporoP37_00275 [Sporosarcina sp. P37]
MGRAVVDLEDLIKVKKHKWYLSSSGYAMTRLNRKEQMFLHRLIVKPAEKTLVDHIDGDTLNNKRANLRECTHQQNIMNQKTRIDNTSGCTGVNFCKVKCRWRARIHVDGRDKHLGYFESLTEAEGARKAAEIHYFGEFRRKNK